jgi:hypothetical protein
LPVAVAEQEAIFLLVLIVAAAEQEVSLLLPVCLFPLALLIQ